MINELIRKTEKLGSVNSKRYDETSISFIRNVVGDQDKIPRPTRMFNDYLSVANLLNLCPRKIVLARKYYDKEFFYKSETSSMLVVFKIGRAAEEHVREQFIKGLNYQGVFGKWVCKCGKTEHEGEHSSLKKCKLCGTTLDHYNELTLFDRVVGVSGNPDIIYKVQEGEHKGKFMVIEIKSMKLAGKNGFEELTKPLVGHVTQASAYRRLLELNGYPVAPYVKTFYVAKDYAYKDAYKEYTTDATTTAVNNILDNMWANAKVVYDYMNGVTNELPLKLSACSSVDSTIAKSCECLSMCFNL